MEDFLNQYNPQEIDEDISKPDITEDTDPSNSPELVEPQAEPSVGQTDSVFEIDLQELIKEGVFGPVEKVDKEGIVEAAWKAREAFAQEYLQKFLDSLPEDLANAVLFSAQTGSGLSEFISLLSQAPTPPTTEEEMKNVIAADLSRHTNLSAANIQKIVDSLDEDELREEAQKAYQALMSSQQQYIESLRQQRLEQLQRQQQEAQKQLESIQQALESSEMGFHRKQRVSKLLFSAKRLPSGQTTTPLQEIIAQISSNPQHFIQLAYILSYYDPKKGIVVDELEKEAASKVVGKIKGQLPSQSKKPSSSSSARHQPDSTSFFQSWLSNV